MKLYGLANCDRCRKALKWLREHHCDVEVIDIRQAALTRAEIEAIVAAAGWERAVNRKSTTWRNLSEDEKSNLNEHSAVELISVHPTVMKRPVIVADGRITVGFDASVISELQNRL